MSDVLYLAWKYLAYHRIKTLILVASITMIVYLPAGLNILVNDSARDMRSRAASTPLLLGARGSPLELVLSSLYYQSDAVPTIKYSEVRRIANSDLAKAIPLHVRYHTNHGPIVGTSLDYFEYRHLSLEEGRHFGMLGECVLGAQVAKRAGLGVGDSIMSLPESIFDIAGIYPLKMKVVGVLAMSGTPDDSAVWVDVKTAWIVAGLAHGHQDLSKPGAESAVLRKEGNTVVANAAVVQYNEITKENVASFHFHGDPAKFPITSVIAVPHDAKSATLLQGRYLQDEELVQIVEPEAVMDELLTTVVTVRRYVLVAIAVVATATLATMTLVFLLSLQARRRELETLAKIGAARSRITALVTAEIVSVIGCGLTLAALLALATTALTGPMTRLLVNMS